MAKIQRKSQSLQGTVQGSNGHSFLPLQAYEIMCLRGEGLQLDFRTDPKDGRKKKQKLQQKLQLKKQ